MRIAQVNSARTFGGGETHVLELTDHLRYRGHHVTLVGRHDGVIKPDVCLPFTSASDFVTAYRLRQFLKKERIDVVHAHVSRDYGVVAWSAVALSSVAVVMTRQLLYPLGRRRIYPRVDGWIATTTQIRETLAPLHPRASVVIPNWVDTRKFAYKPHASLHDPIAIGLVGQISPHKGHAEALDAMRLLGHGYRLLIAGEGNAGYVRELMNQARGLSVEFPGFVRLPDFFDNIDIVIAPSWEEPFGIILLEAMSAGIPLVTTAAGGPLTIVRQDVDGLLVPPKDGAALASAVRRLVDDENGRRRMIASARERVETAFEMTTVVPRIDAFYEQVGRGRRNP